MMNFPQWKWGAIGHYANTAFYIFYKHGVRFELTMKSRMVIWRNRPLCEPCNFLRYIWESNSGIFSVTGKNVNHYTNISYRPSALATCVPFHFYFFCERGEIRTHEPEGTVVMRMGFGPMNLSDCLERTITLATCITHHLVRFILKISI